MSTKLVTFIKTVERTCQGCGKTEKFNLAHIIEGQPSTGILDGTPESDEARQRWSQWIHLAKEVYPLGSPIASTTAVEACSPECVPIAVVKLLLPPEPEGDTINLRDLQQNQKPN